MCCPPFGKMRSFRILRDDGEIDSERGDNDRSRAALLARDKVNLDIFWLKDNALYDPDLLPPPEEVAAEIVESLESALERFRGVAAALGER